MPPDEELPLYPMARDLRCPYDPPPELIKRARSERAIAARSWDGSENLVVTGYDDHRALLSEPLVSSDARHPAFPHNGPGLKVRRLRAPSLLTMDGDEHDVHRKYISSFFTTKRILAFRPRIQAIVDGLIDAMLASEGPVDLVDSLTFPLPVTVTCDLLGLPYDRIDFIRQHTTTTGSMIVTTEEINGALDAMLEYFMLNIAARADTEGDAILDRLARLHEDGTYTLKEAADYALQLVIAGSDTTANMGALGVMVLLEHPEQLAELRSPSGAQLWGNTIEELLRYLNVNQNGLRRVSTGEIALDGLTIPADCGLILAHDVGNRDAHAFEEPNRFDIHRPARHHIAFGDGIHQCLGQGYARLELAVLFETLFRRIPTIRLAAPREELEFRTEMGIYGVDRLPVTWEGRAA